MWRTLSHFPLLSVVFPNVLGSNFWSLLMLFYYSRTFLWMRPYLCAGNFCIVVHLLLPFPFLRKFSMNWWVLPQSQCLLVQMRSCTARSTALVGVALFAPFWLIFSLGSKKDICLIGFLSFTSVMRMIPLFPLDHATMHYHSLINWISYTLLSHLPWKRKIMANCHF